MCSLRNQTGFINLESNIAKKVCLEISGIDIGSDSTIISTISAQFKSHGRSKWVENEKSIHTFSQMRNTALHHQTGFINSESNIAKKIHLEISGIDIGLDSAIISTISVQLRSHS
jgi:hypothetical protein